MENTENTSQAMHLLAEAHRAWERMRPLREKRERNKNFTYGNQWCDMMTDEHGRRVSEWQHLRDNGKDPLTNNLIRQLVKSVVGRFRSRLAAEPAPAEPLHGNLVGELDSRLMEEFLISGCCFQRIDFGEEGRVALSNVSPSILDAMEEFQNYNHLKKAALTAVAYHLNNVGSKTGGDWGRTT